MDAESRVMTFFQSCPWGWPSHDVSRVSALWLLPWRLVWNEDQKARSSRWFRIWSLQENQFLASGADGLVGPSKADLWKLFAGSQEACCRRDAQGTVAFHGGELCRPRWNIAWNRCADLLWGGDPFSNSAHCAHFTLHATGQCELRGHVGNLFQNGPQYVRNIPAAIGDMKILLIRRCPKDPNRKQRIPFLVSRRRDDVWKGLYTEFVVRCLKAVRLLCRQVLWPLVAMLTLSSLKFYYSSQTRKLERSQTEGLEVQVVEQTPWERVERKLFAMWMSCTLELQMAAEVRLLHEPQEDTVGMSLRTATQTVDMSLRTVDKTPETEQPGDSAGMSLRTATQTVDMSLRTADTPSKNQQPGAPACWYVVADCQRKRRHVVADCRHAVWESKARAPACWYVVADCQRKRRHVVADCRHAVWESKARAPACWYVVADCQRKRRHVVADCRSENQKPGDQHSGMSLRTAKESVDMSLRTVGLRIKSPGTSILVCRCGLPDKERK